MKSDLPDPVRRQLYEAAKAEPPAELLDRLAAQVRVTPQRRSRLVFSAVTAGVAVSTVAAGLVLMALVASWRSGPPASTPSGAASAVASATPVGGDGLPATYMGQPVFRGDAIGEHIDADTSSSSFFIGGWLRGILVDCDAPPSPRPSSPLAPWCLSGWFLADHRPVRGDTLPPLHLIVGEHVTLSGWRMADPVILRVHAHDPEAAECAEPIRAECERAVVVEEIVWSGASQEP